jgi:hypothetical protein
MLRGGPGCHREFRELRAISRNRRWPHLRSAAAGSLSAARPARSYPPDHQRLFLKKRLSPEVP